MLALGSRVASRLVRCAPPLPALFQARAFCDAPLRKTPLYDAHVALGGKMVPFGGWGMPVQYPDGIVKSHLWTREKAGLFDVSHMLGVKFTGADRVAFMETVCTADVKGLAETQGTLTLIPNANGGIIDDCIVTNAGDYLYTVINAGHEDKDLVHFEEQMKLFGGDVQMEPLAGNGLLALQGPSAHGVLQKHTPTDLNTIQFMTGHPMTVMGEDCFVTRSGYTGEDGFEIAIAGDKVGKLWEGLLAEEEVQPIGLGARDSLRLEAGLCLYGNDLDDNTTPMEGTLLWTLPKCRRDTYFVGSDVIIKQIKEKSNTKKRVGFMVKGAPAREGAPIFTEDGEQVGEFTSGGFSPSLKKAIGMGYVRKELAKAGTELLTEVRGKKSKVTVTKMPFVEQRYFRGPE